MNARNTEKPLRKRLAPATKARAKQRRKYAARVKVWLLGKKCAADYCTNMATECHHTHGRVGALLLYEPWWMPVCSGCHRTITMMPKWARYHGYICQQGQWNSPPPKTTETKEEQCKRNKN
jgi:hypothetical protein